MPRALLPLIFLLAACTPADPPLLIDDGRDPATAASGEQRTSDSGNPAAPAADD